MTERRSRAYCLGAAPRDICPRPSAAERDERAYVALGTAAAPFSTDVKSAAEVAAECLARRPLVLDLQGDAVAQALDIAATATATGRRGPLPLHRSPRPKDVPRGFALERS